MPTDETTLEALAEKWERDAEMWETAASRAAQAQSSDAPEIARRAADFRLIADALRFRLAALTAPAVQEGDNWRWLEDGHHSLLCVHSVQAGGYRWVVGDAKACATIQEAISDARTPYPATPRETALAAPTGETQGSAEYAKLRVRYVNLARKARAHRTNIKQMQVIIRGSRMLCSEYLRRIHRLNVENRKLREAALLMAQRRPWYARWLPRTEDTTDGR